MQYRNDKYNQPISLLGYGCMRFSKKGASIDLDKTEKEIMYAIRNGVNYFDTAYIYPGSEVALGTILAKNQCRKDIHIATKLPQYLIKSRSSIDKHFEEELRRLQTDYIDYYLMHMLTDISSWEKLCALGIIDWIQEKKESGQIRNIGFSFHGNTDTFFQVLNAYSWDFCQIQYNYLDEHSQAGRRGLLASAEKGIPVIIMEPLRGGKLVNLLPDSAKKLISLHESHRSPAEWALRWLWEQPQVTCVLSGMNSLSMVKENVKIASEVHVNEFSQEDHDFIHSIKDEINKNIKVGCTGCGYCLPCPMNVDIPGTFHSYNLMYSEGKKAGRSTYLQQTLMRHSATSASNCINCGKCEQHCPQSLSIRAHLKDAAKELETPTYKIAKSLIPLFKLW